MDVSRIDAYNPNKINWRNMTAKDILSYEKQGIQVPDIFVQWAHEFLNNIEKYDNDEITYENAQSSLRYEDKKQNDSLETSNLSENEVNALEDKEISEIDSTQNSEGTNGSPEVKTPTAKEKLKELEAQGYDDYKIAEIFKGISIENKGRSEYAAQVSELTSSVSDDEIEVLDGYMADLLTQINDAKVQIQNLKNRKDETVADKIVQLNNEIKKLGEGGQAELSVYQNDFDQFDLIINEQSGIGAESIDYGETTIDVAKKVYDYPNFYMRNTASRAGDSAVKAGDSASDSANNANQTNDENVKSANSYTEKIMIETGVGVSRNDDNYKKAAEKNDPITGKEKESEKDVKTASNDGTDTTDKLHISLDELVKRKVRRGEYAQGE